MSQRNFSSCGSDTLRALTDVQLCIVCEQAAQVVSPFSRHHLCEQHLDIDVQQTNDLHQSVDEKLLAYSEGDTAAVLAKEKNDLERQLHDMERRFAELQQRLNEYWIGVRQPLTARIDAVQKCVRDLDDVKSYNREVKEALSSGKMAEVVDLAVRMEASLPDIAEDFSVCERFRSGFEVGGVVRQLEKLEQMVQRVMRGPKATNVGVTARPETRDAEVTTRTKTRGAVVNARPETRDSVVTSRGKKKGAMVTIAQKKTRDAMLITDRIFMSHELKLDSKVSWVGVCSDTRKFVADRSGCVVPIESGGDGCVALPQPCLVARIVGNDHLTVLSVDGILRFQMRCTGINWNDSIKGIHCDRQLVFVAQSAAVTVVDLSGRTIRGIHPDSVGLGSIGGIGGNAASVFVSSGNKIAAFKKADCQPETVITLSQLPNANLRNLAIHQNNIFVLDKKHFKVHKVRINTQQLVASHPIQCADLVPFEGPWDVAVDSSGRVFISEWDGHTVQALAADDGSLLWTLGMPDEKGSRGERLNWPWGLAVVKGGPCEQLVVADSDNRRLLVLNLL